MGSQHLLALGTNPSLSVPFMIAEEGTLILRQKLTGDNIKEFVKSPDNFILDIFKKQRAFTELYQVLELLYKIRRSSYSKEYAWLENIKTVVDLSNSVISHSIKNKL